jgi:hypothetical protein
MFRVNFRLSSDRSGPSGCAGWIFGTLFCLAFLGIGIGISAVVIRDAVRDRAVRNWPQTQCTILQSQIKEKDEAYLLQVRYRYQYVSRTYQGDVYQRGYSGDDDYRKAQRLLLLYPAQSIHRCYVNPAKPTEAVLAASSPWKLLVVLVPMVFAAIGGGILWALWRGNRSGRESKPRPVSTGPRTGRLVLVLFFGVFFAMGMVFLILMVGAPMVNAARAAGWQATPCVVIDSKLRSHHDSDSGTTYKVNILYEYQVQGRTYRSNRYGFFSAFSSGRSGKEAVVRQHPPGRQLVCWVNPADPTHAVLDRGISSWAWLGLIPLIFVAVGAGGIIYTLRRPRSDAASHSRWLPKAKARPLRGLGVTPLPGSDGPVVLRPAASPPVRLAGAIFLALFWNGIISIFVTIAVKSWINGRGEICLSVFILPFVAIGLFFIGMIFREILSLTNPRVQLTLSHGQMRPGQSIEVAWELTGRYDRISRLRIWLEGTEEATYQRGTTTTTDKHVFARIQVVDTSSLLEIRTGKRPLTVPADTMHSLSTGNNKIVWALHVKGEISRWPDLSQDFELLVSPPGGKEMR